VNNITSFRLVAEFNDRKNSVFALSNDLTLTYKAKVSVFLLLVYNVVFIKFIKGTYKRFV